MSEGRFDVGVMYSWQMVPAGGEDARSSLYTSKDARDSGLTGRRRLVISFSLCHANFGIKERNSNQWLARGDGVRPNVKGELLDCVPAP